MKFYTLVLFFLFTISTYAQSSKFEWGAQLGAGFSELRDAPEPENSIIGGVLGLTFQYNMNRMFSIHSNIAVERKGTELPGSDWQCANCPHEGAAIQLDYVTVPVLARFNFGSKARFFANTGPYVGYLINYEWIDTRFDYGWVTGLGGQMDITQKTVLSLEVRNSYGLAPITAGNSEFENGRYNNSLNLLLGVAFRLGNQKTTE